jgi:hypothetical protein
MRIFLKYLFLIVCSVLLTTCKKKTSIKVKLLNPALNEYVSNARVVLVERKETASGNYSCIEVWSAVTDNNGTCFFDKEKLKSASKYQYFCAVTESWGVSQFYPCAGKASGYLSKGKENDWLMTDYADGYLQIQYNNLLSPSQPGDSLIIGISTAEYYDPVAGFSQGGGSVFGDYSFHDVNNPPNFPAVMLFNPTKTLGGRKIAKIRKRKLGNVTTLLDTIKFIPDKQNYIK